jgi:hypothetical protein
MSDVYIVSTMSESVSYRTYSFIGNAHETKNQSLLPVPHPDPVIIRGGANKPSLKGGFGDANEDINGNILWTPKGVVTKLSAEDYERVKDHWLFQKHLKGGYLSVLERDVSGNHKAVSRVASDMTEQDPSKQLTKETVAQKIKVKVPSKELSSQS